MQNKGIVIVTAVLLTLASIFYLSSLSQLAITTVRQQRLKTRLTSRITRILLNIWVFILTRSAWRRRLVWVLTLKAV